MKISSSLFKLTILPDSKCFKWYSDKVYPKVSACALICWLNIPEPVKCNIEGIFDSAGNNLISKCHIGQDSKATKPLYLVDPKANLP